MRSIYRLTLLAAVLETHGATATSAALTKPPEMALPSSPRRTTFVSFEHVNLNVPTWTSQMEDFWFGALGFASDLRAKDVAMTVQEAGGSMKGLVWANAGLQQVHMPLGEPAPEDSQSPEGVVGLAYPDLRALRSQLSAAGVAFNESSLAESSGISRLGKEVIDLLSPTGVKLRAHELERGDGEAAWFSPKGPLEPAAAAKSGVGLPSKKPSVCLGIPYVRLLCAAGAAAGIRRFYKQVFQVDAELRDGSATASGRAECRVPIGAEQWLVFEEVSPGQSVHYDGHHVAIYVNGFIEAYERAKEKGLLYNNPRFPQLTYDTVEQALQHSEFRVLDIRDPESGEVVHTLEHEVRALSHPGFSCRSWLKEPAVCLNGGVDNNRSNEL